MSSLISIVIATRNRSAQLGACLESLRATALPAGWSAEIIVIDNGSSDDTAAVVASFQTPCPDRTLRYMTEPRQGKTFAINRGTAAARGMIVAFVDDDVVVDRQWLTEVVEHFRRDPKLDLLAGRVVPAEPYGRAVGVTVDGAEEVPLTPRAFQNLARGCNLAVRRNVLDAVKGRDTRLGPGRGLSYEDIDFVYRILMRGFRGRFSPRPTVTHRPGSRNRRLEYQRGRGAYYAKYLSRGDVIVARQAYAEVVGIVVDLWHGRRSGAGSSLGRLSQLAVGAGLMLGRSVLPMPSGRLLSWIRNRRGSTGRAS